MSPGDELAILPRLHDASPERGLEHAPEQPTIVGDSVGSLGNVAECHGQRGEHLSLESCWVLLHRSEIRRLG